MSTTHAVLLTLLILLVLLVGAAFTTRALVLRGMRAPWVLDRVNRVGEKLISLVKRPLTIAVLDEVADVIQTGHYTQNISDAIVENRAELKALVAEKVRHDPNVRFASKLPLYDSVVDHVSETTLRVLVDMLGDPRMDELVSDLLRNNIQQIKLAVRQRQHENVAVAPPDPTAPLRQREASGTGTGTGTGPEPRRRPGSPDSPTRR